MLTLYLRKIAGEISAQTRTRLVIDLGRLGTGRLTILKAKAKVKPAGLMHWNCVRAKQVVFKCSDVATFHQNLALGKEAKLLMEDMEQGMSKFIP